MKKYTGYESAEELEQMGQVLQTQADQKKAIEETQRFLLKEREAAELKKTQSQFSYTQLEIKKIINQNEDPKKIHLMITYLEEKNAIFEISKLWQEKLNKYIPQHSYVHDGFFSSLFGDAKELKKARDIRSLKIKEAKIFLQQIERTISQIHHNIEPLYYSSEDVAKINMQKINDDRDSLFCSMDVIMEIARLTFKTDANLLKEIRDGFMTNSGQFRKNNCRKAISEFYDGQKFNYQPGSSIMSKRALEEIFYLALTQAQKKTDFQKFTNDQRVELVVNIIDKFPTYIFHTNPLRESTIPILGAVKNSENNSTVFFSGSNSSSSTTTFTSSSSTLGA